LATRVLYLGADRGSIEAFPSACASSLIEQGIARASDTLENIEGAWVNEMKVKVEGGRVTEYRVNLKVTFVLK